MSALMTIDEYLAASFDGIGPEYRGGSVIERNGGETPHSIAVTNLAGIFASGAQAQRLYPRISQRLRPLPDRVMVPDVCVFSGSGPTAEVPSELPLIAVEIVSPGDRMSEILAKLGEYATWGVPNIWLADPQVRKLFVYARGKLHEVDRFELAEPRLTVEAAGIFDE